MNLTIDPSYLVSVTVRKEHPPKFDNTEEGLVNALMYANNSYSIRSVDHPEFDKIRQLLEKEGYIRANRNCWNGDRVVKPFTVNSRQFKIGDTFYCAAASKWHLK
jgi:hypothetical protein